MENQIVSTCSLAKEQVGVDRNGPLSLFQISTYATVNTCTGQEVGRYEIKEATRTFGLVIMFFLIVIFFMITLWAGRDRY